MRGAGRDLYIGSRADYQSLTDSLLPRLRHHWAFGEALEIFIEYTPLAQSAAPLALELILAGGQIVRLEPAARGYALLWPDGVIQLELRPDAPGELETGEAEQAAQSVLLRYLALRLAGDAAADALEAACRYFFRQETEGRTR
mgnify:CR=1 FL=1